MDWGLNRELRFTARIRATLSLNMHLKNDIIKPLVRFQEGRAAGQYEIGETCRVCGIHCLRRLSDRMQPARIRGCGLCGMKENCKYRKKGETCGV